MSGLHAPDRRVGRTRKQLSAALLSLLETTPWKKITVQNIIDRADVGRSTFYSHFETKFDLLEAQLPVLAVTGEASRDPAGGALPDFLPLFEHVRDEASRMKPVLGQPVRADISERMHQRLVVSWSEILGRHHPSFDDELTARFLAGATLSSMQAYLQRTDTSSPEEVAAELHVLVANTLRRN